MVCMQQTCYNDARMRILVMQECVSLGANKRVVEAQEYVSL